MYSARQFVSVFLLIADTFRYAAPHRAAEARENPPLSAIFQI